MHESEVAVVLPHQPSEPLRVPLAPDPRKSRSAGWPTENHVPAEIGREALEVAESGKDVVA